MVRFESLLIEQSWIQGVKDHVHRTPGAAQHGPTVTAEFDSAKSGLLPGTAAASASSAGIAGGLVLTRRLMRPDGPNRLPPQ
jgi:hypothetical protein